MTPSGAVCHIELYAHDLKESADFYTKAFGWECSNSGETYVVWKDASGIGGGFVTGGAPMTNPAATIYIEVEDIPAKLKEIVALGCKVIRTKTEIGGGHGFYALFRDPAGNNMGLWSRS